MSEDTKAKKVSRLFDVRLVIGGLFTVYGVLVTILGLFDSKTEIQKAQGVRINLWMGLGMLVLGLLMLLWLRLNRCRRPSRRTTRRPTPVPRRRPRTDFAGPNLGRLMEEAVRPGCDRVAQLLHMLGRRPRIRLHGAWNPCPQSALPPPVLTAPSAGSNKCALTTSSTRSRRRTAACPRMWLRRRFRTSSEPSGWYPTAG